MTRLTLLLLSIALISSCEKKKKQNTETIPLKDNSALLIIEKADSAWANKMGYDPNFTGMHSHGKDLAVHAHQDIAKQRRMLKKGVEVQSSREEAFRRESERRRQLLIERGILPPDTTSSSNK